MKPLEEIINVIRMKGIIIVLFIFYVPELYAQQLAADIEKTYFDTVLIFDHSHYSFGDVFAIDYYNYTDDEVLALSAARNRSEFETENSIENSNRIARFYFSGQANTGEFIGCTDFNININGSDYGLTPPLTIINIPRSQFDAESSFNIYISEGKKQLKPGAYTLEANFIMNDNRSILYHLSNQRTSIPRRVENSISAILIPYSEMKNMEWARADTEKITLPQILIIPN